MDQTNEYYKKIMDHIVNQYLKPTQTNAQSNPELFNFGRAGGSVSSTGSREGKEIDEYEFPKDLKQDELEKWERYQDRINKGLPYGDIHYLMGTNILWSDLKDKK